MPITVDWSNTPKYRITVPQSELTLISGSKYSITVDYLWELLREFSATDEAIPRPVLYSRIPATPTTPPIINVNDDYYDLQFEDGLYSVEIINGNSNLRDVEVKNQVSVGTNNTAGFIAQDSTNIADIHAQMMPIEGAMDHMGMMRIFMAILSGKVTGAGTGTERFRNMGDTKDRVVVTVDANGNRSVVVLDES